MQRIKDEVEQLKIADNRCTLYHGSKAGIDGNIAPISRVKCDFGKGFYMGTDPMQPLTLICDYEKAKFYVMSVALDGLSKLDIPETIEWAMIVALIEGKWKLQKGRICMKNIVRCVVIKIL